MNTSIKRIQSELSKFNNFMPIYTEENNIRVSYILIKGPEKTPYEYGLFFIRIEFGDDYPICPPKCTFESSFGMRMHPNFYAEGKLCLSIINTWGANEWVPTYSLTTLCTTIQAQLDEKPIKNEPGHQKDSQEKINQFNSYAEICTFNILYHILICIYDKKIYKNLTVKIFDHFKQDILQHVKKYKDKIIEKIQNLNLSGKSMYGEVHCNKNELISKIEECILY